MNCQYKGCAADWGLIQACGLVIPGYFWMVQRVLEAFTIILAFTQLLYLLSLHAGLLFDRYGPPTSRGGTGTGTGSEFGEKHQHGTPAAAAGV